MNIFCCTLKTQGASDVRQILEGAEINFIFHPIDGAAS